jgi:hypothetical protein
MEDLVLKRLRQKHSTLSSLVVVLLLGISTTSRAETYDFPQRCSAPGVIKCVGFDSASDIAGGYGDNSGIFAGQKAAPQLDTSMKASGNSSLLFTIFSNTGADASGSYFTNFSTDLLTQFGEGEEFYIQWRQRFSPQFLIKQTWQGSGGWKQSIIGEGDRPGGILTFSCTQLEVVTQNTSLNGFPQMYHSCGGKDDQYQGIQSSYGASDFKLQNAMPSPFCLWSRATLGDTTGCFVYKANQWMTFQVHVKIGTWYQNDGNYHRDSWVELWVAEEGQPSQLVVSRRDYDLANESPAAKYGKVWLLPYATNKSSSATYPTAYTWYDELIISRTRVPDPGSSTPNQPPAAPTGLTVK